MKVSFKGVKPGGAGGVYFLPGNYLVEIERTKVVNKRGGKGDMYVAETIIRTSTNAERKPNTRCNYTLNLNDDTMGICMATTMAINGMDPEMELSDADVGDVEALYEDNIGPDNSAKGRFCEIEARPATMKNGTAITACRFIPIEDETKQAELKAQFSQPTAAKVA